ncbi:MAG: prephenate dehydrogenase, partial [Thermodesulfobacteriota bacterium]
MTIEKVAIIGLGLIGGSLAWALKKSGRVGEVFGVDLDYEAVAYALKENMIDTGSMNLEEGVEGSDVVVIATYVGIIPEIAKTLASVASTETIITDVGSVKGKIVEELEGILPPHLHFVGGHPIAGTERSGVWAADFNLFQGKRCILTPSSKTQPEPIAKVQDVWE